MSNHTNGTPGISRGFLMALVGLQFIAPFVLACWHRDIPDEDAYRMLGRNLAFDHSYHLAVGSFHHKPLEPNTYFAPGWPALLALGYLTLGELWGGWVVLGLVWAAATLVLAALAQQLSLSSRATTALLLWWSLNPLLAYYHGHLMTEALTILLSLGILQVGMQFASRPAWSHVVVLGLLSGVGHLSRTTLLLPVAAVWVVAFWQIRPRVYWPRLLAFAAIHLAVICPWLLRMNSVGGGFSAVELKLGHNLYLYNYRFVQNPYEVQPGEQLTFPEGLESMRPLERDRVLRREAVAMIMGDPVRFLALCGVRARYLFAATSTFTNASALQQAGLLLATVFFYYVPLALACGGVWRHRNRISMHEWMLIVTIALWYAFHIVLHASIRQRLPSDVWVALLCAVQFRAGTVDDVRQSAQ